MNTVRTTIANKFQDARHTLDEMPSQLKGAWETFVQKMPTLPTREEMTALEERVALLEKELESMKRQMKFRAPKKELDKR